MPEQDERQDERGGYMTVREARELLGVTKYKITRLIKYREIPKRPGVRDARTDLVPRAIIEQIAREFAAEATSSRRD